eukprot:6879479-Pyramimonas_sp.AAC.2
MCIPGWAGGMQVNTTLEMVRVATAAVAAARLVPQLNTEDMRPAHLFYSKQNYARLGKLEWAWPEEQPVLSAATAQVPAQSSPVQSSPFQSSPFQSSPVQYGPVRSGPNRSGPLQSTPVHSSPLQSGPVRSGLGRPVPSSAVQSRAVQSSPVQSSPVRYDPVRSDPVPFRLVPCSPVQSSPVVPDSRSRMRPSCLRSVHSSLRPQNPHFRKRSLFPNSRYLGTLNLFDEPRHD